MEMGTALGVNRTVHDACVSTFFTGIGNRRLGAVLYGGRGTTNKPSRPPKAAQTPVKPGENRGQGGD